MTSEPELLRRRSRDCELRARALLDRADTERDPSRRDLLVRRSDGEAIAARVFAELAEICETGAE